MDFYANVDDAVEEAILGPSRNALRNSDPDGAANREEQEAAKSLQGKGL